MKVTLEKDYKDLYTIADLKRAKEVIHQMKEDTGTPADYLMMAANEALREHEDIPERVLVAEAVTTRNCRAWNRYYAFAEGDSSRDIDVLITGVVKTWKGFLEIEACLSDIWDIDGETPIAGCFYLKYYKGASLV